MKLSRLIQRILKHYDGDLDVTPQIADEVCDFIAGQAAPHAVFRMDGPVLYVDMTGRGTASFPVACYDYEMQAFSAATTWAVEQGARTYEWLSPESRISDPKPTIGDFDGHMRLPEKRPPKLCENCSCMLVHGDAVNYWEGKQVCADCFNRKCVPPHVELCHGTDCSVMVAEPDAHYIDAEPFGKLRLCRYHAELHEPEDVCEVFAGLAGTVPDPDDLATVTAETLDRHSSLWRVIACMQEAIQKLSDNEYIYADDEEGTNIHHEEVDVIVKHLVHGNEWSAIQYSDFQDMEVEES